MSQRAVAEALGINRVNVSRWETGKGNPSWINAQRLAELYKCSISDLSAD